MSSRYKTITPAYSFITLGSFLSVAFIYPSLAHAQCSKNDGMIISCDADSTQKATIGKGKEDSNVVINIGNNSQVDVNEAPAISVGNDANITINSGAIVKTTANNKYSQGNYHSGANTIEFNNNGTLIVKDGALVLADGQDVKSEAVNVQGYGNTITVEKGGVIRGTSSAAIWFQDSEIGTAKNKIDNSGTIEQVNGGNVIGTNRNNGIIFHNKSSGIVNGNIIFSGGDDTLIFSANSKVTGNIDGGKGENNLILEGDTASFDTLAGALKNFSSLTKTGDGQWNVTGSLTGFDTVLVQKGILGLTGDNTNFNGIVNVDSGAVLEARAQSLPHATNPTENINNVINNGIVRFVQSDNGVYHGQITGGGGIEKEGSGVLTLSPDNTNTYSGGTFINAGAIRISKNTSLGEDNSGLSFNGGTLQTTENMSIGRLTTINNGGLDVQENTWLKYSGDISGSGDLKKQGNGLLITSGNNNYSGITAVENGILQAGAENTFSKRSNYNISDASVLDLHGYSQIINGITNSGLVRLSDETTSKTTLTVHNDYIGNNGTLLLRTVLGNDNSFTDKLVVNGDATGTTYVKVINDSGLGDHTLEGIEVISTGSSSGNAFVQSGRITAGAYEYHLQKGNAHQAPNSLNNWYLTSSSPSPSPSPSPSVHTLRPEPASYIANLATANVLFNTRLHDRLGETQYVDALTGEDKVTSLWLRQVGSHNNWRDSSGQLKTSSNSYVAQMGGDVAQWSGNGLDRGHLGMMAGYANSKSNTLSGVTGYGSKGSLNGYSVGLYGTWFANDKDKSGLYADSWVQYNWFDNHVDGEELASESYKSKGLTASLESGYTLKMGEFTGSHGTVNEWFIQPQAQATWMGVKADDHRENNGTIVSINGGSNILTRLGMRAFLKSHHAIDDGKNRTFEPFIEANWLHNTRSFGVKMNDAFISQAGTRNIGEVKVGVEGQLSTNLNAWGNVGVQVGDKGYNDSSAMIGVKYSFK